MKALCSPGLSGAGRDEAGEAERGKGRVALTRCSDIFHRRPVPLKGSWSARPNLSWSQRSLWQVGGRRRATFDLRGSVKKRESRGQEKKKKKAKDSLCFSCTGVGFFTRFDANVSFSMLHVSFLF